MNEINKNQQEQEMRRSSNPAESELSLEELDQVSGGVITNQGASWLKEKILAGKAAGSTKENVAFYARNASGKGALAHATGEEASQWVLDHWDKI